MTHEICDQCETVKHCSQHGCIPLQPAPVLSAGPITPEMLRPWTASERSALVAVLEKHGIIEPQPLKPCRSPYCECTPGTCNHPGCYDARAEPFKHPTPAEKPYTVVRNAWTNKLTYTCNSCGKTDFRSEHAARFHICEPTAQPTPVDWLEAVLDLIDECPGLTMDQDRWLTQRVKEIANPPATLEKTSDPCPGCTPGHVCRTPACGRLKLPLDHPLRNLK